MVKIYIRSSESHKLSSYSYSMLRDGVEIFNKYVVFTDKDRSNYKMLLLGALDAAEECLQSGITEICIISNDQNIEEGINNSEKKLKRAIRGEFVNSQEWINLLNCFKAFKHVESEIANPKILKQKNLKQLNA